jgi:prevent-host-death family protein
MRSASRKWCGRRDHVGEGQHGQAQYLAKVATGGYKSRMKHFSIKEAKDQLPALVRAVESGEQVTITRNGKAVVDVIPHKKKGGLDFEALRRWKEERGIPQIVAEIAPDFDDPLPEDFLIRPMP